jgi:cytochrome P450
MTSTQEPTVAFVDHFDPTYHHQSDLLKAARETAWYARTPIGFAILRSEEVSILLKDSRFRPGGVEGLALQGITEGPLAGLMARIILNQEGEDHARLRRLVHKAFTPRAVDALRTRMRAIAHSLIDPLARPGTCEFMADFADPYPAEVMCELLGIPDQLRHRVRGWANDLGLIFSYAVAENRARIESALEGLYAVTEDLLAERGDTRRKI